MGKYTRGFGIAYGVNHLFELSGDFIFLFESCKKISRDSNKKPNVPYEVLGLPPLRLWTPSQRQSVLVRMRYPSSSTCTSLTTSRCLLSSLWRETVLRNVNGEGGEVQVGIWLRSGEPRFDQYVPISSVCRPRKFVCTCFSRDFHVTVLCGVSKSGNEVQMGLPSPTCPSTRVTTHVH